MKNQYILLSTVCCGLFLSNEALSQCVATKDCHSLGYKQSSCDSGKGMKCPFGEAWYCPCDGSYVYSCTSTNESPSSAKCGDKYSLCNCATGTHWDTSKCVSDRASCSIGWIYYNDGTCGAPAAHTGSKVALGVVVYVNPNGVGGQVLSKDFLSTTYEWGGYGYDAPVSETTSWQTAQKDYDSCGNTDKLLGDSQSHPAASAARSYAPTPETKGKWCLPAAGVISSWYVNRTSIDVGIARLGGTQLGSTDPHAWSSSEYGISSSWVQWADGGASQGGLDYDGKGTNYVVRPVLAF